MSSESDDEAREQIAPSRDPALEQVRRKAARMLRGRRPQPTVWRYLAQVGVLGWLFILPVVGLAALGRWIGRVLGEPRLALAGLLAGLALGASLVWRSVQRSLSDNEDAEGHDD